MRILMRMMVCVIVAVAVYDIYCTVSLNDTLIHCEENPLALWFVTTRESQLHVTNPLVYNRSVEIIVRTVDVSQLVAIKTAGLVLSIPVMMRLVDTHRRNVAAAVIIPIFAAACWLLERLVH